MEAEHEDPLQKFRRYLKYFNHASESIWKRGISHDQLMTNVLKVEDDPDRRLALRAFLNNLPLKLLDTDDDTINQGANTIRSDAKDIFEKNYSDKRWEDNQGLLYNAYRYGKEVTKDMEDMSLTIYSGLRSLENVDSTPKYSHSDITA